MHVNTTTYKQRVKGSSHKFLKVCTALPFMKSMLIRINKSMTMLNDVQTYVV